MLLMQDRDMLIRQIARTPQNASAEKRQPQEWECEPLRMRNGAIGASGGGTRAVRDP